MPPRNLSILFLAGIVSFACYLRAPHSREARTIVRAMNLIEDWYVQPVEKQQLFENAMKGMVQELDPYSSFVGKDHYQRFQETLDQEFGGIGILVDGPPRVERMTVITPLIDTPAYEAGVQAGDLILAIDGRTTEQLTTEDAVPLMRGPKGSAVRLTLLHPGSQAPVDITIYRDIIKTESVLGDTRGADAHWKFFLEKYPHIGYIRITSFGEHTVGELEKALDFSQHPVEALLLDLRGNPGGLLESAVETCDMFLDQGRVVTTRGRDAQVVSEYTAEPGVRIRDQIPIVILVDRYSASASEIVAACLQDHRRAVVAGERTWGKGSVQNVIELEQDKSALKLTTATYWRPSGENIHRHKRDYDAKDTDEWGVRPEPELELHLPDDELKKVWEARRERDLMHTTRPSAPIGSEPSESADGSATIEVPPEPAVPHEDPQLKRAIEYLESQLKTPPAGAKKA